MSSNIRIKIENLDKVINNLDKLGRDLPREIKGAGIEASNEILNTRGLRKYPPLTQANLPPPPYYIRGRGTQLKSRNLGNSKSLGTRWQVRAFILANKRSGVMIRNPTEYAPYVHGERQSRVMKRIGWRIIYDVAKEKRKQIETIYNKWIRNLLRRHGL